MYFSSKETSRLPQGIHLPQIHKRQKAGREAEQMLQMTELGYGLASQSDRSNLSPIYNNICRWLRI